MPENKAYHRQLRRLAQRYTVPKCQFCHLQTRPDREYRTYYRQYENLFILEPCRVGAAPTAVDSVDDKTVIKFAYTAARNNAREADVS